MPRRTSPTDSSESSHERRASASSAPPSAFQWIAGLTWLLIAFGASLALVLQHFGALELVGCGIESDCARAARSQWGKVPGLNLPTSSVGLAYFTAAIVGWLLSRRGVSAGMRWTIRLGALVSLGFMAIIVVGGFHCPWCIAAHAGNLAFWLVAEFSGRTSTSAHARPAIAGVIVTFIAAVGTLGIAEALAQTRIKEKDQAKLAQDTQKVIDEGRARGTASKDSDPTKPEDGGSASQATVTTRNGSDSATIATSPQARTSSWPSHLPMSRGGQGFTGRYLLGPPDAPIRIVMISDYQCPDCRKAEAEITEVMNTRSDISLSHKHFPMSNLCNKYLKGGNPHPNACWAARAAETAGMLYGPEAFWKMHFWLHEHEGRFETKEDLTAALNELGLEVDPFLQSLETDQTLEPVLADIEEGASLGLYFTPMIFINGTEVRGFINREGAIKQAILQIAAANLPPGDATMDHPVGALEKAIADWKLAPVIAQSVDEHAWPTGPTDAPIRIVVFTDYNLPQFAMLDKTVRAEMKSRGDILYTVRHYPLDAACNPTVNDSQWINGCLAAAAADAAGMLGGSDAYWKMHDWLMSSQRSFTQYTMVQAAAGMGLDQQKFTELLESEEVARSVRADIDAGMLLRLKGVPAVCVNDRLLLRLEVNDQSVLAAVLNEIRQQSTAEPAGAAPDPPS